MSGRLKKYLKTAWGEVRISRGYKAILIIVSGILIWYLGFNQYNYSLFATFILILAIAGLFFWAQKVILGSKHIVLIATVIALAALGRIPFAAIPNVQPTTFMVMISGFVMGPQVGFMVGATAALVSNFFLGQGPWTPWQMIGWGLVGLSSAYLPRLWPHITSWGIALFGGLWGFIFGWIQNTGFWITFVYPLNIKTYLATYATSFVFDSLHALCNFLLSLLLAVPISKILNDYQEKLNIEYIDDSKN